MIERSPQKKPCFTGIIPFFFSYTKCDKTTVETIQPIKNNVSDTTSIMLLKGDMMILLMWISVDFVVMRTANQSTITRNIDIFEYVKFAIIIKYVW